MKLPWKWIIFGTLILFALLAITYGGTGYKMARDWIVGDQAIIQRELEAEVTRLDNERSSLLKELSKVKAERLRLNGDYQKLKDKYAQLEHQMGEIIVPTDPNDLVLAFRKRDFKSANLLRSR